MAQNNLVLVYLIELGRNRFGSSGPVICEQMERHDENNTWFSIF
jgi:hypothetical protein